VTVPKAARIRRAAPAVYEVHVRDLDSADVTRFEGIRVVTPLRAPSSTGANAIGMLG